MAEATLFDQTLREGWGGLVPVPLTPIQTWNTLASHTMPRNGILRILANSANVTITTRDVSFTVLQGTEFWIGVYKDQVVGLA